MNQLRIRATSVAKGALRHTPAGVAVLELSFRYDGVVTEAGAGRTLTFEFAAVAVGTVAQALDREPLGAPLMLEGFIAPRTHRTMRLLVHITEYRSEGN